MDDVTLQQAQTHFRTLPSLLRDALSDPDTYEKIAAIGKRNDLTKVEVGLLAQVTGNLMMGFLKPNEFVATVMDYLTLPRDKAILITQDLNRDIFNDVKDVLKDIHAENKKPSAQKAEKPANIPTGVLPAVGPALPPSPTGPIRSDWGWHGRKNEATGQIEFKRETVIPEALTKKPVSPFQVSTAGPTHVGSIFEQKLGGAFRVKGESVQYEVHPVVPPKADTTGATPSASTLSPAQTSREVSAGKPPPPVQGETSRIQGGTLRINPVQSGTTHRTGPQGSTLNSSTTAKPTLRVPHKPIEIKIPPAQATQPPR